MKPFLTPILLALGALLLIGFQQPVGFLALVLGLLAVTLFWKKGSDRAELSWLFVMVGLLYFFDINTDITNQHILQLGGSLLAVILGSYYWIKKYGSAPLEFSISWPKWSKFHTQYLLLVAIIGGTLIPFYLKHSGAYLNWEVFFDLENITKLFVGTNGLGIWDELFFINVVFVLLRRHFSLLTANFTQAIIFTSFLYELGFTGWGPLIIYPFALIQGWTYEKTKSLGFVILAHLLLDLILFLSLLYWHAV